MRTELGKRAQTTAEYAIVIALVIGAVVAMQVYVKRGLQGRVKNVVDHAGAGGTIGDKAFNFSGEQYEPYYSESTADTSSQVKSTDNLEEGGMVARGSVSGAETAHAQRTGWREHGSSSDSGGDFTSIKRKKAATLDKPITSGGAGTGGTD